MCIHPFFMLSMSRYLSSNSLRLSLLLQCSMSAQSRLAKRIHYGEVHVYARFRKVQASLRMYRAHPHCPQGPAHMVIF